MEFASRTKRSLFVAMLLGLVPDVALSALAAWLFQGGVPGFLFALVGLQLVYFVLWLKQSLWAWFLFSWGGGRKRMASLLLDDLVNRGFPEPGDYHQSAESYFTAIAGDDEAPVLLRLTAMSNAGVFAFLGQEQRFQDSMRLSMAYEDALIRLKRARQLAG